MKRQSFLKRGGVGGLFSVLASVLCRPEGGGVGETPPCTVCWLRGGLGKLGDPALLWGGLWPRPELRPCMWGPRARQVKVFSDRGCGHEHPEELDFKAQSDIFLAVACSTLLLFYP